MVSAVPQISNAYKLIPCSVPIALFLGFILPTILGSLWNDPWGSFIWAGLLARLFIWHSTFLVNSFVFRQSKTISLPDDTVFRLAHWDGLQPYSDENTSRGNLLLALMTGGEGNHNFVSFHLFSVRVCTEIQ